MYIYTRVVMDFEGNVLEQEGYEYDGPVAECKGASQEERDQAAAQADLAKKQTAFYDTMSKNYAQMFAGQTAILGTLQKTYEPIFKAGPNQYGFNRAQDVALRTMASEGTAQSYKMAKQAVAEQQAAAGGDSFIPQGSTAQVRSQLASQAAAQESQQQLGITNAGYEQGRQNFYKASEALGGVAHEMNPLGYAGQSSDAAKTAGALNQDAFSSYSTIYQQDKASSPWNIVGGILGGVGSAFLGPIGGAAGSAVARAFGGGAEALPAPRSQGPGNFFSLSPSTR